ncbi:MAB_1171c family putative transporter [Streptomyces sp. NPDC046685]|uniref:MAB_1171c family putative transporter n=1 Tax=Streptomyces sp. NPDC046685 TaxID=3157202 RepID=UPI00340F50A0
MSIAATGFLFLLRDLRKDRRDHALVALAFTYFFSALSYAISLTPVWIRIDSTLGVTNIAVPLAQSCVILVLTLQATVLAYWTKPPAAAARRTRFLFALAISVICAMSILFVLLTPVTQRPVDFSLYYAHDPVFQAYLTLYITTYTVAELYLAWVCWKYAGKIEDRWISRGLRLITVGAIITLGYSGIRISAVLGSMFEFSVKHLEPWAWICGDIGATLTQVGYFLPIVAVRLAAGSTWVREHRQYRRLQPLWQAMYDAVPSINLMKPADQRAALLRLRPVHFELYRRAVEIRDGQIELRPFVSPEVREDAERRRRAQGLTGPELAAAVTADQIRAALIQKRHGTVENPASYADATLPTPTTSQDLHHLVRVAVYFGTPTVPQADLRSTTGART